MNWRSKPIHVLKKHLSSLPIQIAKHERDGRNELAETCRALLAGATREMARRNSPRAPT